GPRSRTPPASSRPGSERTSTAVRPPSAPARSAPARTPATGTRGDPRFFVAAHIATFSHSAATVGKRNAFRWCLSRTVLLVSVGAHFHTDLAPARGQNALD